MARILVIEDDPWMADCYKQWLIAEGHKVECVRTAQAALDNLDNRIPDLIMLDLLLPHANGVQLLHTLQSHHDLAQIPVLLCSSSLPKHVPPLSAYGVRKVLDKASLTPRVLAVTVKEILSHAAL